MAPSEAWLLPGAQTRSSWSIIQNTSLFPRSLAFSRCSRRRPRVSAGKDCGGDKSRNDETTHDQRSALPAAVDRRVLLADSANPAILSSHRSGRGPSGILVVQFLGRQYPPGILPALGSYTIWGHRFAGEMQTAAFYPLHLLLALFPFNSQGVFSPQLYHQWFAFAHFLGACFMFALAREMRLSRFSSIIAGICFSFGGFVVHAEWPDMLQSAIWLPLVFLFFLRAMRTASIRPAILYASLSGLSLGLAILAGSLHVGIMQTLVVLSAGVFAGFHPRLQGEEPRRNRWVLPAVAAAVVAVVAFCAGAVQLFPSMEYSGRALRFLGVGPALPATQKIPYAYLGDGLWPHGLVSLLLPFAFNGNTGPGETMSPYMGVFPLLAAIVALWRCL